jgi:hypothetical protein
VRDALDILQRALGAALVHGRAHRADELLRFERSALVEVVAGAGPEGGDAEFLVLVVRQHDERHRRRTGGERLDGFDVLGVVLAEIDDEAGRRRAVDVGRGVDHGGRTDHVEGVGPCCCAQDDLESRRVRVAVLHEEHPRARGTAGRGGGHGIVPVPPAAFARPIATLQTSLDRPRPAFPSAADGST